MRALIFACVIVTALQTGAQAQYTPLPDYPADTSNLDVNGNLVDQYAVIPFVFHSGLTYNIDSASSTGIMANLGQNVIQIVGEDADSLGQGFWYQLMQRKHNLLPGYGDSLYQNYPNPFNPATYVPFSISSSLHQHRSVHVVISLTSVLGIEVARLVDAQYGFGYYAVLFNANAIPSGMYIYSMTVDDFGPTIPIHEEFSRKMHFLR